MVYRVFLFKFVSSSSYAGVPLSKEKEEIDCQKTRRIQTHMNIHIYIYKYIHNTYYVMETYVKKRDTLWVFFGRYTKH